MCGGAIPSSGRGGGHLTVTVAPAPSRAALALSAASLATFSRTGFGALSTRSLASLRPSEVRVRTSLMTWIFLSPAASRMTSNSSCSAAASSPPPPPPAAGAAATAMGAAAVTSNVSSNCFTKSDSSRRVISLNASSRSELEILAMSVSFWSVVAGRVGGSGVGVGGGVSSSGVVTGGVGDRSLGSVGRGSLGGRSRLVASGLLLLERLGEASHLGQRGLEQPGRLRQVALHRAGQLGQQDLTALDVGEARDLGRVDRAALDHAALDDQGRVRLREVTDGLGRRDGVTLDEGDRGGTVEQRGQVGETDRVRRPLRQGVLDDGVAAALTEGTAQLGQLGHGQPAVLGEHRRAGLLEPLGDLVDHRGLCLRGHGPPLVCRATTGRRTTAGDPAPRRRGTPRRSAHGARNGRAGARRSNRPPARVARYSGTFDRTRTCDDQRSWGERRQEYAMSRAPRRAAPERTRAPQRRALRGPRATSI